MKNKDVKKLKEKYIRIYINRDKVQFKKRFKKENIDIKGLRYI